MIDGVNRVTQVKVVRQVVKLKQGGQESIIERQAAPTITVVRSGLQGPVGTVAEEVLTRAERAEQMANQTTLDLTQLITDMDNAFVFHTGVIST